MTARPKAHTGPPAQIYIIRHGEKPADPPTPKAPPSPPFGVDINGNQSIHSLLPRGWHRSGALAVLFARSYQRADEIHRAMLARGFRGRVRSLEALRFQLADAAFAAAASLIAIVARLAAERLV